MIKIPKTLTDQAEYLFDDIYKTGFGTIVFVTNTGEITVADNGARRSDGDMITNEAQESIISKITDVITGNVCHWQKQKHGVLPVTRYLTGCNGDVQGDKYKYCPYCGKTIEISDR